MSTALRLDRLSLRNFRCFADCSLDLHEDLTVFVAENGRGKTALLDGIGVALGTFVDAVSGTRQFHGFERADVRLIRSEAGGMTPALPTRFVADGCVAGQQVHWSRSLQKYSLRAYSEAKRSTFRSDCDQDSEGMAIMIPRGSRSVFGFRIGILIGMRLE